MIPANNILLPSNLCAVPNSTGQHGSGMPRRCAAGKVQSQAQNSEKAGSLRWLVPSLIRHAVHRAKRAMQELRCFAEPYSDYGINGAEALRDILG